MSIFWFLFVFCDSKLKIFEFWRKWDETLIDIIQHFLEQTKESINWENNWRIIHNENIGMLQPCSKTQGHFTCKCYPPSHLLQVQPVEMCRFTQDQSLGTSVHWNSELLHICTVTSWIFPSETGHRGRTVCLCVRVFRNQRSLWIVDFSEWVSNVSQESTSKNLMR